METETKKIQQKSALTVFLHPGSGGCWFMFSLTPQDLDPNVTH